MPASVSTSRWKRRQRRGSPPQLTAQLSGRMRRFRIRVIPGDRVQVGVSPYDPTHGFITFRLREGQTQVG